VKDQTEEASGFLLFDPSLHISPSLMLSLEGDPGVAALRSLMYGSAHSTPPDARTPHDVSLSGSDVSRAGCTVRELSPVVVCGGRRSVYVHD
jgi:hypothetical protein